LQSASHGRSNSDANRSGSGSTSKPVSRGATIPEASSPPAQYTSPSSSKDAGSSSHVRTQSAKAPPQQSQQPARANAPVPQYPTAEEEKAALRRYQEAKDAVVRTQGFLSSSSDGGQSSQNPISYDSLYPASSSGSMSKSPPPTGNDLPPPFAGNLEKPSPYTEKERLRRAFEAQDSAAMARQTSLSRNNGAPAYDYKSVSPPPFVNGGSSSSGASEISRRNGSYQAARPSPGAPQVPTGAKILSALEEKALLKAKYDAEERAARPNGTPAQTPAQSAGSISSFGAPTPPTPPPLAPRPPAEYIQETQEEDARVSRYVQQGITPPLDMPPTNGVYKSFTPMSARFESGVQNIPGALRTKLPASE
jgi:hypothetical protein